MNVQKTLPTPAGRPILNVKYSAFSSRRGMRVRFRPWDPCFSMPGEHELGGQDYSIVALEIDNRRPMSDQCEERRSCNPQGLKREC
jgi:hypothetical protein